MIRKAIYSIRNFFYYRRPRRMPLAVFEQILATEDKQLAVTEMLLGTVGLKVVACQGELDGIYLTTIQRISVAKIEANGYYAGLR